MFIVEVTGLTSGEARQRVKDCQEFARRAMSELEAEQIKTCKQCPKCKGKPQHG